MEHQIYPIDSKMTRGKKGQGLASLIMGMALTAIVAVAIVNLTQEATEELRKTDDVAIVTSLHKLGLQKATTKDFINKYIEDGTPEYECLNGAGSDCQAYSEWRPINARRVLAGGGSIDISSTDFTETKGCFSKQFGTIGPSPADSDLCEASNPYYREILFRLKCPTNETCTGIETKVRTEYQRVNADGTLKRLYVRENTIPLSLFSVVGRQLSGSNKCADGKFLSGFLTSTGELNCVTVNPSQLTTFASSFNINGSCPLSEYGMNSTNNNVGSVYCASETLVVAAGGGGFSLPVSSEASSEEVSSEGESSLAADTCTVISTTSFTPGIYDLNIPSNAKEMNVKLWGAGGRKFNEYYFGGWGGYTEANFRTSDIGLTLKLIVGTNGEVTSNPIGFGGSTGGGGLTGIFTGSNPVTDTIANRNRALAIAGGGGGANIEPYTTGGQSSYYSGKHGNADARSIDRFVNEMTGSAEDTKASASNVLHYGNGGGGGYSGGKTISTGNPSFKGAYGGSGQFSELAIGSIADGRVIKESYSESRDHGCSVRADVEGHPQNVCLGNGNKTREGDGGGYAIITYKRCVP